MRLSTASGIRTSSQSSCRMNSPRAMPTAVLVAAAQPRGSIRTSGCAGLRPRPVPAGAESRRSIRRPPPLSPGRALFSHCAANRVAEIAGPVTHGNIDLSTGVSSIFCHGTGRDNGGPCRPECAMLEIRGAGRFSPRTGGADDKRRRAAHECSTHPVRRAG